MNNKYINTYNFNHDDEYYTYKSTVEEFINTTNMSNLLTVWCPFDTENSAFVKVLKEKGFKVIYSHIENGQDFYNYEPSENYDIIFSNPPFHGKANLIQRCLDLKKPFILLFGIQCFNSGRFTRLLSEANNIGIYLIEERIGYHKGIEDPKIKRPSFHSCWICGNINESFVKVIKKVKNV